MHRPGGPALGRRCRASYDRPVPITWKVLLVVLLACFAASMAIALVRLL
jgi:hypothetical protein